MTAAELVSGIRERGGDLFLEGDKLRCKGPASLVTKRLVAILADQKAAVVTFLKEEATAAQDDQPCASMPGSLPPTPPGTLSPDSRDVANPQQLPEKEAAQAGSELFEEFEMLFVAEKAGKLDGIPATIEGQIYDDAGSAVRRLYTNLLKSGRPDGCFEVHTPQVLRHLRAALAWWVAYSGSRAVLTGGEGKEGHPVSSFSKHLISQHEADLLAGRASLFVRCSLLEGDTICLMSDDLASTREDTERYKDCVIYRVSELVRLLQARPTPDALKAYHAAKQEGKPIRPP